VSDGGLGLRSGLWALLAIRVAARPRRGAVRGRRRQARPTEDEHPIGLGWRSIAIVGAIRMADDRGVLGTRRQRKRSSMGAAPSRAHVTPRPRASLAPATERLMRAAVAVRRAAGDQPSPAEMSLALEHLEQTLDDLSEGMARMSGVSGERDPASGGLAWRLQTLRHALSAARHVCSRARAVVPKSGPGRIGGGSRRAEPRAVSEQASPGS
jgi:hypothetical protein